MYFKETLLVVVSKFPQKPSPASVPGKSPKQSKSLVSAAAADIPVLTQKSLPPQGVQSLQRTIGNTATIRLLAQQRNNAPTDTSDHINTQTKADLIQRFPTATEVAARSSKKSKPKSGSAYDNVLEAVNNYNIVVTKTKVPLTLKERKGAVEGAGYDGYLNKILNLAQAYITKHETKKKDRAETVASFKTLVHEVYVEKHALAKVVKDASYDANNTGITWREAIDGAINGRHPGIIPLVRDLGLPASYLEGLDAASIDHLTRAVIAAKAGNAGAAQVAMAGLERTQPNTWRMVRSALFRANIQTVHPELAPALLNPNFRQTNKSREKEALTGSNFNYNLMESQADVYEGKFYGAANAAADDKTIDAWIEKQASANGPMTPAEKAAFKKPIMEKLKARQVWEKANVGKDYTKNMQKFERANMAAYSNDFKLFNNPLRGDLMDKSDTGFGKDNVTRTQNLVSALNALKPYVGRSYRHDRLYDGFMEMNQVGAVTTDMAFLSSTRELSTLKEVAGSGNPDVLIVLESKTGRFTKPLSMYSEMLEALSNHRDESEVLFKPGTRFRVVRRFERADFATMDDDLKAILNSAHEKNRVKVIVHKAEI